MEEKEDDAFVGQEIRLKRNVLCDIFIIAAEHEMFQDTLPIKRCPIRYGFGKLCR